MWEQPPFAQEPDGEGPTFRVLVEYTNQGQAKPSTLIEVFGRRYSDLDEAVRSAQDSAFSFRPPDPWSPQGRTVYRVGEREYLTMIDGVTATFHFTTRVVEEVTRGHSTARSDG
ncbi:MAG TPA: hypothetical protein VIT20_08065 [Propionibacteriaceae bacterium]